MAKVIKVGKGATQYKVVIAKNALTKVNLLTPLKTKGKVLINGFEIETKRVDLLNNLNFISPYIELPKKLKVKQSLKEMLSFRTSKSENNDINQNENFEVQVKEENYEHSTISGKNRRRGNKARSRRAKGKSRRG